MPIYACAFGLAPIAAISLALFIWRVASRKARWPAFLLLLPVAMEGCWAYFGHQQLEALKHIQLNPGIERSQVIGTWQSDKGSVTFKDDGTFTRSSGEVGTWACPDNAGTPCDHLFQSRERRNWYGESFWAFYTWDGELRLLGPEDTADDGDAWSFRNPFVKARGAR